MLVGQPPTALRSYTRKTLCVDYGHARILCKNTTSRFTFPPRKPRKTTNIRLHTRCDENKTMVLPYKRATSPGLVVEARESISTGEHIIKSDLPSPKPCTASPQSLSGNEPCAPRLPSWSAASRWSSSPSVSAAGLDLSPGLSCFYWPSLLEGAVGRLLLPPAAIPPASNK